MAKILIIEDEPKIAQLVSDYLIVDKHETEVVQDGALAIERFNGCQPDVVLLDLMLPNKDGIQVCQEIRQQSDVGIIMVTARVEEVDRLLGLEIGADDYVCKPFSPKEVVARVNVLLRRLAKQQESEAEALWQVDEDSMTILLKGEALKLTHTEFRILAQLIKHKGKIYSRVALLDLAYEDFRDNNDRAIDSHIKNLRKKLKKQSPEQDLLQSVYGVGYKVEI